MRTEILRFFSFGTQADLNNNIKHYDFIAAFTGSIPLYDWVAVNINSNEEIVNILKLKK